MPPPLVCLRFLTLADAGVTGMAGDPMLVVALALGAMILLYFVVLRPRAKKGQRPDPLATPPSQRSSLAGERAAERQMQVLLDELEQVARQMTVQLDTRTARLEALIREADAKIATLHTGLARVKSGRIIDGVIAGSGDSGAESGLAALAKHREIYDLADGGKTAQAIAQKLRRPSGEVELILALRNTGGSVS